MSTLIDSLSTTNTTVAMALTNKKIAQSFTGANYLIDTAEFYLQRVASPTGTIYARLYSHSGTYGTDSTPNAALSTSAGIDVSTLSSTAGWVSFTFGQDYTMTTSYYCISVEYQDGDNTNYVNVGRNSLAPHSGNESRYAVSWTAISASDMGFKVYGALPTSKMSGVSTIQGIQSIIF